MFAKYGLMRVVFYKSGKRVLQLTEAIPSLGKNTECFYIFCHTCNYFKL